MTDEPRCRLCGSPVRRAHALGHTASYACSRRGCELEFAHPQLDDAALERAYNQLYYPGQGASVLENTAQSDVEHYLDLVSERFGPLPGKRVLDYGCGIGTLLKVVSERGGEAVGIEPSANARAEIARAGFARTYASVEDLVGKIPDARFDLITLCAVLEHLRSPWEEVAILRRLLAPGGSVILTVPNARSLKALLLGKRWDQRTNITHFYYFTATSMKAVLTSAGFHRVTELPPIVHYQGHGPARRGLQTVLARLGMQGGLFFAASV